MSKERKVLLDDVKYETECWVEAARRATVAKRAADDAAREESLAKCKAIRAIEALAERKASVSEPTAKEEKR